MKHSDQNLCRTILNRITIQQKINLLQKQSGNKYYSKLEK